MVQQTGRRGRRWRQSVYADRKTISIDGKVTDGPIGAPASGYSLIKTDSLAAAVELAKGCPVLKGGAKITVYETFAAMPG